MNDKMLSPLVYAYIGDAVYEVYIRKFLISTGICKVNELNKKSHDYVSAVSQRRIIEKLLGEKFLTNDEIDIYKSGRNTHGTKAKHTDIITYRMATGFETLIGYLYLKDNIIRVEEIIDFIVRD